MLDEEARLRFSGLELIRSSTLHLARYNILVFPPVFGGGKTYRHLLGDEGVDRLKRWIESGGTAIGIGSGAEFLADPELKLTATRLRRHALDRFPPPVLGIGAEEAVGAGRFRAVGTQTLDTRRLLLNAVLYGPGSEPSGLRPGSEKFRETSRIRTDGGRLEPGRVVADNQ